METNYNINEYEEARKVVNKKIGFYIHLSFYLVFNAYFHYLNFKYGGGYWAIYPAAAWGIGLLFHGVGALGFFNQSSWKHKQILKEIEKQKEK